MTDPAETPSERALLSSWSQRWWVRLKLALSKLSSIPIWVRTPIATIFVGLLGAGFVGLLSEYATYYYALGYGVRPSLEGTPFLTTTVSVFSFCLYVGAFVVFGAFTILFRSLARMFFNVTTNLIRYVLITLRMAKFVPLPDQLRALIVTWDKRLHLFRQTPLKERIRSLSIFEMLLFGSVFSVALSGFFYLYFSTVFVSGTSLLDYFAFTPLPDIDIPAYVPWTLAISVGLVASLLAWREEFAVWVSGIVSVLFFLFTPLSLFDPSVFSGVLRGIGYGGGIPVSVQIEPELSDQRAYLAGHLIIRTTEALMVYVPDDGSVVEVPISSVRSITYEDGYQAYDASKLPDRR